MKKIIILILLIISIKTSFAQWAVLDTTHVIEAVCLLHPNDGWSFGSDFRHWDGTNWTTVIHDTAFGATSCSFPSVNNGWVFGLQDSVYRYNGSVWTKQYTGIPNIYYCSFYDDNHGWISNSDSVFGYHYGIWTLYTSQLPSFVYVHLYSPIEASDSNNAWFGCHSYYSTAMIDSSYIFNTSTNPCMLDTSISGITFDAISFTDPSHGWMIGRESNMLYDKLFKYNGSGWTLEETFPGHSDGTGLFMYSNSLGWLSREYGIVYNYDGFSWTIQDTLHDPVRQFSFSDSLNGWVLTKYIGHPYPGAKNWLYTTSTGGVGIKSYSKRNTLITIFPNPATTSLTIQTPQASTIEIFNLEGQILRTIKQTELKTSIDVSQLSAGIYFIRATSEKGAEVRKFVKQ